MTTIRRSLLILGVLILALVLPVAVSATPSTPVTITTHVDFSGATPQGSFVASSPLCSSGTFVDTIVAESVGGSGRLVATARKLFTCSDGSGTFTIQIHPKGDVTGLTFIGPWAVIGGTGAYATLHGTGTFTSILDPTLPTGTETFVGTIHFD